MDDLLQWFASMQELRKKNTAAIKRQRKTVEGKWTDKAGYDLITVPKVRYALSQIPQSSLTVWLQQRCCAKFSF